MYVHVLYGTDNNAGSEAIAALANDALPMLKNLVCLELSGE